MNVTTVKEACGTYFRHDFSSDLKAGFITAIVALPLAIAFALASGVEPIMGLYTAVIAGVLVSAVGGSRFSITGPTGAMTVIILSTVQKYGIEGLLLAGFLAGIMQVLIGALKLGKLVKYIPFPVVSGFTAGIGLIIFIGQIPNGLGLAIEQKEHIWERLYDILLHIGSANPASVIITVITILLLIFLPKLTVRISFIKNIPASMIALLLSTLAVFFLHINTPQVGLIPSGLPVFHLISFNFDLLLLVLPAALTIALLGTIEALLCAVVCDGMTNTHHDSDKELVAQGAANIVLPFFMGIASTAAIARSAVNIREGAKTRMAGVIHALFLLLIVVFFAPVAGLIPKAFLAGVLMYVSARMINITEFKTIMHISRADTIVLYITFILTVLTDLVFAVEVGMILAMILIFIRLSKISNITHMAEYDQNAGINQQINAEKTLKENVNVYTLHGPFFFGAMNMFERKMSEHLAEKKKVLILRMKNVPFIDTTGVERLITFIKDQKKQQCAVLLSGLKPDVYAKLHANEEFNHLIGEAEMFKRTTHALEYCKILLHR